ncbi:hypothetical protein P154DRAFT_534654 [Amniculicola lignicola CBS 123094]|uniref:Uncharacterized protein n=1 Tax=Amniculicola lignicola CBS 123094 TaxID=1392246 RepID=A0A6A5WGQ5_9PLEO|nr:hypothetical protein P154DRAFT_534654 [Amniculicola lignicola CBS 123094]
MVATELKASKWANRDPAESIAYSRAERVKKEKEKVGRLMDRVSWKAELLRLAYGRALEILHVERVESANIEGHNGHTQGTRSKKAETMFKIDFFEFYTLLERYITLCLSTLGVSVSSSVEDYRTNFNALRLITNPALRASHAFHANLLTTLDEETGPLYEALGNHKVRAQLGAAKDYRNRWKGVEETTSRSASRWGADEEDRKRTIKLEELDLDNMLSLLLAGCEQARLVVQDKADTFRGPLPTTNGHTGPGVIDFDMMETEDAPYEYQYDAMEID